MRALVRGCTRAGLRGRTLVLLALLPAATAAAGSPAAAPAAPAPTAAAPPPAATAPVPATTPTAASRVLTLEEALETARIHQPQVQASEAQVRAARARVGEAFSAYLPRLDANAQYQRATGNFTLSPGFAKSGLAKSLTIENHLGWSDSVNYYTYGAIASALVYDFGRTQGSVGQARAAADASRANLDTSFETTALNVKVAYYQVLATKALVKVGEDTVANQDKHVKQIRQFVAVGIRAKIDLTSVELTLANAELALLRARNAVELAKVSLNQAMGVEGPTNYEVVVPALGPLPEETQSIDVLMQEAARERPELKAAAAQVRLQRAARVTARSGYFPDVVATANLAGTKVQGFPSGLNWTLGVGLSWNLFSGLLTLRQVEEADANIAAAEAQLDVTRQSIRAEIEGQLLAVGEAKERVRVTARAVELGNEQLRLAEGRYAAGTGSIIELDDAQVSQATALAQQVSARYDLAVARARLKRAVGLR